MGSSTGCGEAEGSPSWSIGHCRIWRTPIRSAKAWLCGGASSNKRRLTPQAPSRGFLAWIDWCRTRAGWLGPPCLASAAALIRDVDRSIDDGRASTLGVEVVGGKRVTPECVGTGTVRTRLLQSPTAAPGGGRDRGEE